MTDRPEAGAKPSLRAELLFNLAFLAAAALVLAMVTALLAPLILAGRAGIVLLTLLIALDLSVVILFGRFLISRQVTGPVEELVRATDAVARGVLSARVPPAATRELDILASSVNRMTERLLDAQSALVRAEKLASVGRLAAGIAHEIGNPLSAAGNYAEVLRRRGGDAELLAALRRELERIDAIVKSLLAYARPRPAAHEPLDLEALARGAIELLSAQGVLRPVAIDLRSSGRAPVVGDASALEQVCVNLLLNAVDAAGEGGRVTVTTGPATDEGARRRADDGAAEVAATTRRAPAPPRFLDDRVRTVQLVVADSGPGVPPEDRNRVFDPFFTTKPPGKGTGLGLAIVQRVVHDHGGRIDVRESREGGAAFVVTLPEGA